MSLRQQLLDYLKGRNCFVIKGDLERYANTLGHYGDNASRRLRELAEDNEIESEIRKNEKGLRLVWYKIKIKGQQSLL